MQFKIFSTETQNSSQITNQTRNKTISQNTLLLRKPSCHSCRSLVGSLLAYQTSSPDQASKQHMKKKNISSAISDKNFGGRKSAMKKFLKNLSFGVEVKLQVPPLMYGINAHNMNSVRSQVVMVVIYNYVCILSTKLIIQTTLGQFPIEEITKSSLY